MNTYIITFYRPEFTIQKDDHQEVHPSYFMWYNLTERNKLITAWAEHMAADTNREPGTPLFEYQLYVNSKVAMHSDDVIENDHDYSTGPDPLDLTDEEYDDIQQILALAGSEHDTIQQRQKNEQWISQYGTDPVPGPGRAA